MNRSRPDRREGYRLSMLIAARVRGSVYLAYSVSTVTVDSLLSVRDIIGVSNVEDLGRNSEPASCVMLCQNFQ